MARHIFVSYVRENAAIVERLAGELETHGVKVWLDRKEIALGTRWRDAIRQAIRRGALFLACFSAESAAREHSYMNEELTLAIDELRQRPTNRTWFIPVLLHGGHVPDRAISSGETLRDLQWLDLASDWQEGVKALLQAAAPKRSRRSATNASFSINDPLPIIRSPRRAKSIFLSYPVSVRAYGAALCRHLIPDFVIMQFKPALGSVVQEEIKRQIRRADYFLAIWAPTGHSSGEVSPWLPYELGIATALNKRTLVVVASGIRDDIWRRIHGNVVGPVLNADNAETALAQVAEYCKKNWNTRSAGRRRPTLV